MYAFRAESRECLGANFPKALAKDPGRRHGTTEDVAELGTVEAAPKQDGRNMTMVIAPNKKPTRPRPVQTPAPADAPGA